MSTINTNVQSLNAQRNLASSTGSLSTSMQRLSSGLRVNSAKDDAAGLAISERMNAQVKGMNVAIRNANDGISLAQTAEGALGKVGDMLQRVRELAVQSVNATNSDSDRSSLQAEANQLRLEIDRVAEQTSFNNKPLLDGSFANQAFQVGANQGEAISITTIASADSADLGTWNAAAVIANETAEAGAFGTVTLAAGQTYSLEVGGTTLFTKTAAGAETATAAEVQTGIDAAAGALATAGITVSGTVAGGDLQFSKTDGTSMNVVVANTGTGTGAGFAGANFATGTNVVDNGAIVGGEVNGFADLDISTVDGANNAILAMDAAISAVSESRGELGAIQSRFENAIASLQVNSENTAAARGRIVDADFAKETANLSRSQILQQAGTAMIAQANQLPQGVLSLLR